MKKLIWFSAIFFFIHQGFAQNTAEVNYDESKVTAYNLPDVLNASGKVVRNKADWEKLQRPRLLDLFAAHIYGKTPVGYDKFSFSLINEDPMAMNGKAHLKQVNIRVSNNKQVVNIHLVLFIPNSRKKPAPVFLLINNRDKDNTDPLRIKKSDFWPAEMLIDSGYAIAAFQVADLAPDEPAHFQNGVLKLYPEQLTADNGMKAIGAWAWGASRVMDYFVKSKDIDAKKVALVGHSRGGKTSLWAAAQDQRFAMCFSNCSGNSGAALSRRKFGETIAIINTRFPHWFNNNYKKYNHKEQDLPVDQHMLIALLAPRPVYVTNASEDLWADPTGTFLAIKNAEPVYQLYGIPSGLPQNPPAVNTAITASKLGYHNREGIHDLTAFDWHNFILFANYNYKKRPAKF